MRLWHTACSLPRPILRRWHAVGWANLLHLLHLQDPPMPRRLHSIAGDAAVIDIAFVATSHPSCTGNRRCNTDAATANTIATTATAITTATTSRPPWHLRCRCCCRCCCSYLSPLYHGCANASVSVGHSSCHQVVALLRVLMLVLDLPG